MAFKRSSVRSRYPPLHNPLQNKGLCRFLVVPHWWAMRLAPLLHHICTTFRPQFHVSYMFDRWDITNQSWCSPESLMVASWATPPCDRASESLHHTLHHTSRRSVAARPSLRLRPSDP